MRGTLSKRCEWRTKRWTDIDFIIIITIIVAVVVVIIIIIIIYIFTVWTIYIGHCFRRGHQTMVYAICFTAFQLNLKWQSLNKIHNDVIKWKHFPCYWHFVRWIHRSPVDSHHKYQWRGTLSFSLIWSWTNGWASNRGTGDWKCHRSHYDVTVMKIVGALVAWWWILKTSMWNKRCGVRFQYHPWRGYCWKATNICNISGCMYSTDPLKFILIERMYL